MEIETVTEITTKYIVDGVAYFTRREAERRVSALNARALIKLLPTVASKARWYLVRNQAELNAIHLWASAGGYAGEQEYPEFFPAWVHVDVFYDDDPSYGDCWSARVFDLSIEMLEEMAQKI